MVKLLVNYNFFLSDCKLAIFNLIKKVKDEADELFDFFEEIDDKEIILRTIMIQQQIKTRDTSTGSRD